jgi:hypothetical protein
VALLGASFAPATLAWGAASGVVSAVAFALLYGKPAIGPMNVLFPGHGAGLGDAAGRRGTRAG